MCPLGPVKDPEPYNLALTNILSTPYPAVKTGQEDFYIFRQKHKPGSLREQDFVQSAAGVQKGVLLPGKKDA